MSTSINVDTSRSSRAGIERGKALPPDRWEGLRQSPTTLREPLPVAEPDAHSGWFAVLEIRHVLR